MTQSDNGQSKWRVTKFQWLMAMLFSGAGLLILVSCNSPTARTNLTSEPISVSRGGDELGVVVDENMKVLHVEPGWPAAVAGLQEGDILDSVDGISFAQEKAKAKAAIQEPKKDKKLKLQVKRAEKTVDIDITAFQLPASTNLPTVTPVWPPNDYF